MLFRKELTICSLIITAAVTAAACSSAPSLIRNPELEEPPKVVSTPTPQPSVLNEDEITELKNYAENYQPKSGREVIPSPPDLPGKISQIIVKAAAANSREHEKFVLLIFIRISRFQIENFRQRYELGRTNPLTQEFYRLIGRNDFESREANLAYLADNHVEKNPELRQYDLIDTEMQRIAKTSERIE